MTTIADLTDATFDEQVLQAELPVLVDFGAEWCHPCKMLDPIVEELAAEWQGKVQILKLDIDANVDSAMRFGVMGVPTLMLFIGGEPVERVTGFIPKKRLLDKFGPLLG